VRKGGFLGQLPLSDSVFPDITLAQ